MADIIRPTFGKPKPSDPDLDGEWLPMEVFGKAAGHVVGFVRGVTEQGEMVRVVVGPLDGNRIEMVALIPDEAENEEEILALAMAALRTLEVVAGDGFSPPPTR